MTAGLRVTRDSIRTWLVLLAAGVCIAPDEIEGQVILTQEEALEIAFPPPASVERRTAFLAEEDLAAIQSLAQPAEAQGRSVVSYYVGSIAGKPLGVAYFDAHRVRTLQEVLMVVIDPQGRIDRVEVLAFAEPPEYMAPGGWLKLLTGRDLDAASRKADLPMITGATLTARSTLGAVRRSLALHQVIRPLGGLSAVDRAGSE